MPFDFQTEIPLPTIHILACQIWKEIKEPIIVGLFILQSAKLRMLELYYNFFTNFCDFDKYEEMEVHAGSMKLALAEKKL